MSTPEQERANPKEAIFGSFLEELQQVGDNWRRHDNNDDDYDDNNDYDVNNNDDTNDNDNNDNDNDDNDDETGFWGPATSAWMTVVLKMPNCLSLFRFLG